MNTKIVSGINTRKLASRIANRYSSYRSLDGVDITRFSDGEIYVRYQREVRGADVFVIQSTNGDSSNIMELLLLVDAAKRASARTVTAVIPYFGYARQDRKSEQGVPISGKLMANLLVAAGVDRVVSVDVHTDQLEGFFDIPFDHLSAMNIFVPYISENYELKSTVIASPDTGGAKRASRIARALGVDMVMLYKERNSNGKITSMKLLGDVNGKSVLLVDDIVDTAGTITEAADVLMENGALMVDAVCTHAVLSAKGGVANEAVIDKIRKSVIRRMIVTDTTNVDTSACDRIVTLSADLLIEGAIRRAENEQR